MEREYSFDDCPGPLDTGTPLRLTRQLKYPELYCLFHHIWSEFRPALTLWSLPALPGAPKNPVPSLLSKLCDCSRFYRSHLQSRFVGHLDQTRLPVRASITVTLGKTTRGLQVLELDLRVLGFDTLSMRSSADPKRTEHHCTEGENCPVLFHHSPPVTFSKALLP